MVGTLALTFQGHGSARDDGHTEVYVVLSAFNGSRYIAQQIASIREQSWRDWRLLVRDDMSEDDTRAVVEGIAAGDPRIRMLPSDGQRLGAISSFGALLERAFEAGASHVFLADQDDFWLPDKMERALAVARSADPRQPLLVHSDLRVVDNALAPIADSFMRFQRLSGLPAEPLSNLLAQNFVTGCTMLVNRALLEIALPIPPRSSMHDWWLAQCAAATGTIAFLPDPCVLYRQHNTNAIGAAGVRALTRNAAVRPAHWWRKSFNRFLVGVNQIQNLSARFHERGISGPGVNLVKEYGSQFTDGSGGLRRVFAVRRLGVAPQTLGRRLVFYTRVALAPRV